MALRKEVFIEWEEQQVLSTHFKQIKKAKKKLVKWHVMETNDDVYVADQIHESDWFLEETMNK